MGFYLRKTIKLGGVNLNLSGSGLGLSTGVKGFRVGLNGRGTYVQMGRGGLYYRKQFSWARQSSSASSPQRRTPFPQVAESYDQSVIFTQDLAQPMALGVSDADDEQVLAHFRPQTGYVWTAVAICVALCSALYSPWLMAVLLAATAIGAAFQRRRRQGRVLIYDLDDHALRRFETFVNAFGEFFTANSLWLYEQRSVTTDWKRNAGATNLMRRRLAAALASGDPKIHTNISIPCLRSGQDAFHFLPDMVVCRQGESLRAFSYGAIRFHASHETFIEEQGVPSDAQVIGHTWKYVRKDGGPDRRFNNNRQLPVCRYQAVGLSMDGAFERLFSKSHVAPPQGFERCLKDMTTVMSELRTVKDLLPPPGDHAD